MLLSDNPLFEDIMQMDNTGIIAVVYNEELRNVVAAHHIKSIGNHGIMGNGFGIDGHNVAGFEILERIVCMKHPPEVTIGDNANKFLKLDNGRNTKPFRRNFKDHRSDVVVGFNLWFFIEYVYIRNPKV